jgi:hypothetical protein
MPKKKIKITKLGTKKWPATKKKVTAAHKKTSSPHDKLMLKLKELIPAISEAQGDALESWSLLAHKLLLATRMKTTVYVVTVNPLMLEHREVLTKEFKCTVQNPTEARFGADSIQQF